MRPLLLFTTALIFLSSCLDDSPKNFRYIQGEYWIDNFRNNSLPSKTFVDDKIYCSSINIADTIGNYLYCLNLKTGKVDWTSRVDNWASMEPIVKDSFIYFCSFVGDIYKFDKQGKELWKAKVSGSYSGHYINPHNNNLMVKTVTSGIYEYDFVQGNIVNHYGKTSLGITAPVFCDSLLFIGGITTDTTHVSKGEYLLCYNEPAKKEVWRKKTGEYVDRLFINDKKLYYLDYGATLNCVDIQTGNTLWKSDSLKNIAGSMMASDPHLVFKDGRILYYETSLYNMVELDGANGKTIRQFDYTKSPQEKLLEPNSYSYTVTKDNQQYKILVSNKLEVPEDFETTYNVTVQKK